MLYEFLAVSVIIVAVIVGFRFRSQLTHLPATSRRYRVRYAEKVGPDLAVDHIVDEAVRAAVSASHGRSGAPSGLSMKLGRDLFNVVEKNDIEWETRNRLVALDPPFETAETFRIEIQQGRAARTVQAIPQWRRGSERTGADDRYRGEPDGYDGETPGPVGAPDPPRATRPRSDRAATSASLSAVDPTIVGFAFTVSGPVETELGRSNFSVPSATAPKLQALRVSRVHLKAKVEQGVLKIKDLDSRNGTYVNGNRVKPGTWTPVTAGTVRMGDAEFLVSLIEA